MSKFKKFLTLALSLSTIIWSPLAFSESSVWKISKGDDYFYLGGTIHLLSPSDYPLPAEFEKAYSDADTIIFETDIAESKSLSAQQKMMAAMAYTPGKTLTDDLNDKTFQTLKEFLAQRNVPVENFLGFKPWAVALTLTLMEYQINGMTPGYGVEEFFEKKALADSKPITGLESIDEQIAFIKSMEKIDHNVVIDYTIRDLKQLPEFITEMKSGWRTGKTDIYTNNPAIIEMKKAFPDFYNTLITERNNKWMSALKKLDQNDAKEFVMVGALHLGDTVGLLHQLKQSGYKIEQL